MITHLPGFSFFLGFLRHLVLVKLATSKIRVKEAQASGRPLLLSPVCAGLVTFCPVHSKVQWFSGYVLVIVVTKHVSHL